jgi:anti-sigma B factor antagonist
MEIDYKDINEHKIMILHGDMDYFSVSELKNALFKLIHEKTKSIILDLSNVEYIDSSGIGLLVNANKVMSNYNGRIGLLNIPIDVLHLLKLSTIDSIISIYKSEKDIK